jgi:DNA modification methylase
MIRPAVTLHLGDCLDVLRQMPEASVDAVVTDPPYGLSFMGKRWDYDVPAVEVWAECLRVLKPGGHLLAFAGTRTQHRMAVRIEDAGFEIRDLIAWVYGSGFPKSLDVSKAMDRAAGLLPAEAKGFTVAGYGHAPDKLLHTAPSRGYVRPSPATDAARQWAGWGTALKPALEPITVARRPMAGTVAANVIAYGTGAINVDGCRVQHAGADDWAMSLSKNPGRSDTVSSGVYGAARPQQSVDASGRWPANLIHDGSDEVTDLLGSAARFFYCAKASRADREAGCEGLPQRTAAETVERAPDSAGMNLPRAGAGRTSGARNHHPTVKPTDLMRYLCRLVTPPGGVVLDPFMGSGSTGRGAVLEGFSFVGIEREAEYLAIARARIDAAVQEAQAERPQPSLFDTGHD